MTVLRAKSEKREALSEIFLPCYFEKVLTLQDNIIYDINIENRSGRQVSKIVQCNLTVKKCPKAQPEIAAQKEADSRNKRRKMKRKKRRYTMQEENEDGGKNMGPAPVDLKFRVQLEETLIIRGKPIVQGTHLKSFVNKMI